jgi:hypothetical protein
MVVVGRMDFFGVIVVVVVVVGVGMSLQPKKDTNDTTEEDEIRFILLGHRGRIKEEDEDDSGKDDRIEDDDDIIIIS